MINGHYLENYLIERDNPKSERYNTWWGENIYNNQFSPYERTTKKVKTINSFLYGSEFLLGNKKFGNVTSQKRKEVLDGFYDCVISRSGYNMLAIEFTTTPFARRIRLFV